MNPFDPHRLSPEIFGRGTGNCHVWYISFSEYGSVQNMQGLVDHQPLRASDYSYSIYGRWRKRVAPSLAPIEGEREIG